MFSLLEDTIDTPLGSLWIICGGQFRPHTVEWDQHNDHMRQLLDTHYRTEDYQRTIANNPGGLSGKLPEYLAGNLSIIDSLETVVARTPSQREVWQVLYITPYGQVMHYGQLAEQLGHSGAARTVGATNGSNPVSIAVPCHRVIGRNGIIAGYAGGVQQREWLLRHEGYLPLQIPGN